MEKRVKPLKNEQWKRVRFRRATNNYLYEISSHGRAKSINKRTKDERLLLGSVGKRGLKVINVRLKDGGNGHMFVHKFVATNFVKKSNKNHTLVLHKNGDRSNNKASNLNWASSKQWAKHIATLPSVIEGRKKRSKSFKLTEAKVKQIKKQLQIGKSTKRKLAQKYKVTETQIRRIETGENWRHVKI